MSHISGQLCSCFSYIAFYIRAAPHRYNTECVWTNAGWGIWWEEWCGGGRRPSSVIMFDFILAVDRTHSD
jgi:hypothetical protein